MQLFYSICIQQNCAKHYSTKLQIQSVFLLDKFHPSFVKSSHRCHGNLIDTKMKYNIKIIIIIVLLLTKHNDLILLNVLL